LRIRTIWHLDLRIARGSRSALACAIASVDPTGRRSMAAVNSTMLPLGTVAPDFCLEAVGGGKVGRDDFAGRPLLVAFICNHCPFVKHIAHALADFAARRRAARGRDGCHQQQRHRRAPGRRSAAHAGREAGARLDLPVPLRSAAGRRQGVPCCMHARLLSLRRVAPAGLSWPLRRQPSAAEPAQVPDGRDLRAAVDALLAGRPVPSDQLPSIGCNIKWKAGNAPEYFQL
jgi:hypothetical protein